jgi:hypothetical protein
VGVFLFISRLLWRGTVGIRTLGGVVTFTGDFFELTAGFAAINFVCAMLDEEYQIVTL